MGDNDHVCGASPKENKIVTMMKRLSSLADTKSRARADSNHELAPQPEGTVDLEAQYVVSPHGVDIPKLTAPRRNTNWTGAEQSQSPTPSDIQYVYPIICLSLSIIHTIFYLVLIIQSRNQRRKSDGKVHKCLLSCCGWNKERGEWSAGRFWSIVLFFGVGVAIVLLIMAVGYYIVRKNRK